MANCIGALVRRRDGDTSAIWIVDKGFCNTVYVHFYRLLPCCFYNFRLQIPLSTIFFALVSSSLRRTSAPIQFTIVLGVLGTQETFCYLVARLLRPSSSYASYGLINLRSSTWGKFATVLQTCALAGPTTSTRRRLCSRHQALFWRRYQGGECLKVYL